MPHRPLQWIIPSLALLLAATISWTSWAAGAWGVPWVDRVIAEHHAKKPVQRKVDRRKRRAPPMQAERMDMPPPPSSTSGFFAGSRSRRSAWGRVSEEQGQFELESALHAIEDDPMMADGESMSSAEISMHDMEGGMVSAPASAPTSPASAKSKGAAPLASGAKHTAQAMAAAPAAAGAPGATVASQSASMQKDKKKSTDPFAQILETEKMAKVAEQEMKKGEDPLGAQHNAPKKETKKTKAKEPIVLRDETPAPSPSSAPMGNAGSISSSNVTSYVTSPADSNADAPDPSGSTTTPQAAAPGPSSISDRAEAPRGAPRSRAASAPIFVAQVDPKILQSSGVLRTSTTLKPAPPRTTVSSKPAVATLKPISIVKPVTPAAAIKPSSAATQVEPVPELPKLPVVTPPKIVELPVRLPELLAPVVVAPIRPPIAPIPDRVPIPDVIAPIVPAPPPPRLDLATMKTWLIGVPLKAVELTTAQAGEHVVYRATRDDETSLLVLNPVTEKMFACAIPETIPPEVEPADTEVDAERETEEAAEAAPETGAPAVVMPPVRLAIDAGMRMGTSIAEGTAGIWSAEPCARDLILAVSPALMPDPDMLTERLPTMDVDITRPEVDLATTVRETTATGALVRSLGATVTETVRVVADDSSVTVEVEGSSGTIETKTQQLEYEDALLKDVEVRQQGDSSVMTLTHETSDNTTILSIVPTRPQSTTMPVTKTQSAEELRFIRPE